MRQLSILVIAFVAACGKEETPAAKTPALNVPEAAPSVDKAKSALDKSIADTKALIEKKQADMKALLEKVKTDPMKAATYKAEADQLQKEITDLQTKLEGYMKEAAGK
jgi:predicted  nucleic acid-binding Zn-ribbon protein